MAKSKTSRKDKGNVGIKYTGKDKNLQKMILKRRTVMTDTKEIVETIPGLLSVSGCREAISFHGNNINGDISSTFVNSARIDALRSLLDLFETYNNKIIRKENE